jgi:hypothetical protein
LSRVLLEVALKVSATFVGDGTSRPEGDGDGDGE